tara:strand:- start:100 stop:1296 length:1197 start_codon:yes stop_codon:yes gene_type:complete
VKLLFILLLGVGLTQTQFNINNLLDYGDLKFAPNNPKPYTGKVFDLNPSGVIKVEGAYLQGKRNGKWLFYNDVGKVIIQEMYLKGQKNGKWSYYNQSGKFLALNNFKLDVFIGDTLYNVQDGQIISKESYRNNIKDGKSIFFQQNGLIRQENTYKNGLIHGVQFYYDDYGKINIKSEYDNGIRTSYKDCNSSNVSNSIETIDILYGIFKYEIVFIDSNECYDMELDENGDFIKNGMLAKINNGEVEYFSPIPRPSIPIASDEEFPDEDYEEFESNFDDWEDWDAPPPSDKGEDLEFVAYDKAPLSRSGKSIFDYLEYPKLAIEMKLEGRVFMKFFIDKKGKVRQNSVQMIRGNPIFEAAAVSAIKKSEWKPAMQRDMKVGVWMTVPVNFKLKDAKDDW